MTPESHLPGYDPAFLGLRKRLYAESEPISVLDPTTGTQLSELCLLTVNECSTHFKCLTHPSSYFSPSLRNTDTWNASRWSMLFTTIRRARGWALARFMMLTDDQSATLRKNAATSGYLSITTEETFRVIPGNQTYTQYLGKRSSKHNANNRRCLKKAEKLGFTITSQLSVDEIADVYLRRTGKVGEADYSVTPQFIEFLRGLREAYLPQNRWVEVGVREPEGRLSAFAVGFWGENQIFYVFQTGYDPTHHSLRLGSLVFDSMIESTLKRGCSYLSFMSSSEYLANYASDTLRFNRVDVFNWTAKGIFLFAYRWLSNAYGQLRSATGRKPNETRLDRSKMAPSGG